MICYIGGKPYMACLPTGGKPNGTTPNEWDILGRNGLVYGEKQKTRVFFDIDGTLAEWQVLDCSEDMLAPNFFAALPAYSNMLDAVKILAKEHSDELALFSLSHCLDEVKDARAQKNSWLDAHAPDIERGRRIYCSCLKEKSMAVPGGVCATDLLVDDYTKNLLSWAKQGKGIKVLNGVNHTRGTWTGPTVNKDSTPREIADAIYAAAMN